jgi:two-component SAPR family response regulator
LLGQILVCGNLLLVDVVVEGLSPVHVYHHDLLASWQMRWVSGHGRRLRDGWRMKLLDEDTRWYLSASRTKLLQDVHYNVVVADGVMELETIEFVLELADF